MLLAVTTLNWLNRLNRQLDKVDLRSSSPHGISSGKTNISPSQRPGNQLHLPLSVFVIDNGVDLDDMGDLDI
jgi:hypothetical protein